MIRNRTVFIILYLIQSLIFIGCLGGSGIEYYVIKNKKTGIHEEDKIVILAEADSALKIAKIQESAGKCLSESFLEKNEKLKIFSSDKFKNIAFINSSESCEYNATECHFHAFLNNPNLIDEVKALSIRYIIMIKQKTIDKGYSADGRAVVGSGYGGIGILPIGFISKEGEYHYSVSIYDLKNTESESGFIIEPSLGWDFSGTYEP